jgi:hypothetical protein
VVKLLFVYDFSENYSTIQDEAQGFLWVSAQASVYQSSAYYSQTGMIQHISFVVVRWLTI